MIGWFLFWVIIYWKGVAFMVIRLPAMGTVIYLAILGGAFVLAFGFWWLISLSPEHRSAVLWVLLALCLVLTPSIFYLLFRKGRREVRERVEEIQNRVGALRMRLERDPKDWSAHLGLAKIYDGQNKLEEAIEAYSSALSIMGESPLRFKTEGQVEFLKRLLERKKAERTLSCGKCGANNSPKGHGCENCGAPLYKTIFHWMFANLDLRVKYALLGMVVLFSIFALWVNPIFVFLLILLWSFDIIYFSLPVEFKD